MIAVRKRYIFISVGLVGLILAMLLTGGEGAKERVIKDKLPLTIDTVELEGYDYNVAKGYIGTLYPAHTFELHSNVGGRIVGIHFDIGDPIQNGATVALIDDTPFQLEWRQAQGRLNIEQSKVRQKEMSIELAGKEYTRMLALRAEKVISESSLEKAKFDFEQQKMTFEVDKANLEMQETAVELSELEWSYTKIKARWAYDEEQGTRVLAERFVDRGAMVTPNTTIATIIDLGLLKAEIFVGEKEYPHFQSGMKVEITVEAFTGEIFEGTVDRVAPFINELTRQAKVQISLSNEDLRLRPGMFARTSVIFRTRTDVQMVPRSCIVEEKGVTGVFLYHAGSDRVEFLPVQVGAVRQGKAEIVNADQIKQPVVSVGQHMLEDGDAVHHIADDVSDVVLPVLSEQQSGGLNRG